MAGPGSGKTRVLAARVARLILQGTQPENIMVLTFTNKAANELKERLQRIMQDKHSLKKMWTGTFHGLANRMVRCDEQPFASITTIFWYTEAICTVVVHLLSCILALRCLKLWENELLRKQHRIRSLS